MHMQRPICSFVCRCFSTAPPPPRSHYEVVIGGGGVMGCSTAYFLSQRISPEKICIVERDPKYEKASTVLSVGSIRQQFSLTGNILLSMRSADFLRNLSRHLLVDEDDRPDINFVERGYLFLASNKGEKTLRENHNTQKKLGARNRLIPPSELSALYPWMNTDDLSLGCLGIKNEGWFDPYLLLSAFKRKVLSLGVNYIHGEVTGLNTAGHSVKSVEVISSEKSHLLNCEYFVNAAGPHAAKVAQMAGIGSSTHPDPLMHIDLPVRPRKRMVFVLSCPTGPTNMPMLIDSSGYFVREETQKATYICGISPDKNNDPDATDLDVDYSMFEETIWPLLAHRIPAFEATKVQSAWAGYYDYNTFDQNGIIGAHPYLKNFIFVNGFSGHGIQQSPEVGKTVSKIIIDGSPSLGELKAFVFQRFIDRTPLLESNIV